MLVLVLLLHGYYSMYSTLTNTNTHAHTQKHAYTYMCTFNFLKVLFLSQSKFRLGSIFPLLDFPQTKSLVHFQSNQNELYIWLLCNLCFLYFIGKKTFAFDKKFYLLISVITFQVVRTLFTNTIPFFRYNYREFMAIDTFLSSISMQLFHSTTLITQ